MVVQMKAIETALSLTQSYKLAIERLEKMLGEEISDYFHHPSQPGGPWQAGSGG